MLSLSDWVLITTTLFLGAVALFVPYLAELVKRWLFAPSLKVSFNQSPPACHRTFWESRSDPSLKEPVFFFRFEIENLGKSQARLVEVILEELWVFDASGKPHRVPSFSPVNLRYDEMGSRHVDINPRRRIFWNIGHISSPVHQAREESRVRIDVPGASSESLAFFMELLELPFGQPNCLAPGKYGLKVSIYAENTSPQDLFFSLDWSGKWQDGDSEMFREIVLNQVRGLR